MRRVKRREWEKDGWGNNEMQLEDDDYFFTELSLVGSAS